MEVVVANPAVTTYYIITDSVSGARHYGYTSPGCTTRTRAGNSHTAYTDVAAYYADVLATRAADGQAAVTWPSEARAFVALFGLETREAVTTLFGGSPTGAEVAVALGFEA